MFVRHHYVGRHYSLRCPTQLTLFWFFHSCQPLIWRGFSRSENEKEIHPLAFAITDSKFSTSRLRSPNQFSETIIIIILGITTAISLLSSLSKIIIITYLTTPNYNLFYILFSLGIGVLSRSIKYMIYTT